MRVLLTGAGGQLGRALIACAPPQATAHGRLHAELDVTNAVEVRAAVESIRPDWVFNAAAYTAVDTAEREPAAAYAANETAVGALATAASAVGARLMHVSTDFVFDGTASTPYLPDTAPAPLGVYGASKLAGERCIEATAPTAVVVRTSWVYATRGRNFVRTILGHMKSGAPLRVVYDQVGSPTWAVGLAEAIWAMAMANVAPGTYHWRDGGVASWYDFAVAIQEEALARGLLSSAVPIEAIRSADYPTAARRPAYSVLDIAKTVAVLGRQPKHWRVQLRDMLNDLATP